MRLNTAEYSKQELPIRERFILVVTIALFSLPIFLDIIRGGWKRSISYFAADTFYYLTIAQNYATKNIFPSFDQEFLTNGFHPLWGAILAIWYRLAYSIAMPGTSIMIVVVIFNVILIGLAIWLLGKSFFILNGRIPHTFILLPIGVYGLLLSPIQTRYGSMWSYANGMESSLTIFFFAVFIYVLTKTDFLKNNSVKVSLLTGISLGLVFLSRLDYIFLTFGFLGTGLIYYFIIKDKGKLKQFVIAGLCVFCFLMIYLAFNYFTVGTPFPVSGSQKSSFPIPSYGYGNLIKLFEIFIPDKRWGEVGTIWRLAQIIVPSIVAIFSEVWIFKRIKKSENFILADFTFSTIGLFVLILGAYNFLFVRLYSQGHWYFPISVLFASLLLFYVFDKTKLAEKLQNSYIFLGILIMIVISQFVLFRSNNANQQYVKFYESADSIRDYYGDSMPKIISYDDGIIAYATGFPTMSGLGFALDEEAARYKDDNKLLELALSRGYEYIASHNYFNASKFSQDTPSEIIEAELKKQPFFITEKECLEFDFQVDYQSEDGKFAIFKIIPN